ncbi:unnamed protein product [Arctogadus glacialis]
MTGLWLVFRPLRRLKVAIVLAEGGLLLRGRCLLLSASGRNTARWGVNTGFSSLHQIMRPAFLARRVVLGHSSDRGASPVMRWNSPLRPSAYRPSSQDLRYCDALVPSNMGVHGSSCLLRGKRPLTRNPGRRRPRSAHTTAERGACLM